ncbi:MAG: TonB-dependent receptor, partial [Rhodospirillales bacterium]|nr:TonB-dependent receptor [Rhodospirillales bacterium]
FRASDGRTRDVNSVLGSGGTSYAGERDAAGAFAEVSLPLADTVDVRAAARADELDDVGGLRAWRLGAEYRPNDIVTLRGSWSAGDGPPSMNHLHSTAAQDHPYVRCVPESGPPPRTCDAANFRQVTRLTSGNPELEPSRSERHSFGAEARNGPFYLVVDWYRLETSDLPGRHDPTWAMLNHPECPPGGGSSCIERAAGDITIHERFANIVETEITGINTRFGARTETGWGFVAMRGFWRYVTGSDERIAGVEQPYPLPRNAVRIVTSAGRGDLTAFWALNYRDAIENRWDDGEFSSWTGHDLTLDWRAPLGLENMRVTAGVYNVTDEKLSTNTADPSDTDGPRAAGWGRTYFATLNMRF